MDNTTVAQCKVAVLNILQTIYWNGLIKMDGFYLGGFHSCFLLVVSDGVENASSTFHP
jgi:hypothetical protein